MGLIFFWGSVTLKGASPIVILATISGQFRCDGIPSIALSGGASFRRLVEFCVDISEVRQDVETLFQQIEVAETHFVFSRNMPEG